MFKHSGSKLKIVAIILAALGALLAVVAAVALVMAGNFQLLGHTMTRSLRLAAAVGIVVLGVFFSWVVGLVVHGYGELVEKSKECEYMLTRIAAHSKEIIEYISRENKPQA